MDKTVGLAFSFSQATGSQVAHGDRTFSPALRPQPIDADGMALEGFPGSTVLGGLVFLMVKIWLFFKQL